jgi:hypothetical protein
LIGAARALSVLIDDDEAFLGECRREQYERGNENEKSAHEAKAAIGNQPAES